LPVTINIVKIGAISHNENDSTKLFANSKKVFDEAERVFMDLYEMENYKTVSDTKEGAKPGPL
jgi:hypothetical protein